MDAVRATGDFKDIRQYMTFLTSETAPLPPAQHDLSDGEVTGAEDTAPQTSTSKSLRTSRKASVALSGQREGATTKDTHVIA